MKRIQDDILSYREMCDAENVQTLQRGMNFRMNPAYSVILMSQRSNAPYQDKVHEDGITIEYEGHDVSKRGYDQDHNPKFEDQPDKLPSGRLTQNGYFIKAANSFNEDKTPPESVKVYEKIFPGVWSLKGFFDLIDYKIIHDGRRKVFRYILQLSDREGTNNTLDAKIEHTRLIPSDVKREVWKRDAGRCVICSETKNLHFDHDLPFSRGGTSLSAKNVRLLCMKHQKAANKGVNLLYDYALHHNLNCILDGTFAYAGAEENIERSLAHNRRVELWFVYQDPIRAWEFTKAREARENRHVSKGVFIRAIAESRRNARAVKEIFKDQVELNLLVKDYEEGKEDSYLDISGDALDRRTAGLYTVEELEKILV